jgi:hypothetical protein
MEIYMDAKEFLDLLKDDGDVIPIHYYQDGISNGFGYAVVIDHEESIAVFVTDCGDIRTTRCPRGTFVKFATHPEVPWAKVVGSPAYFQAIEEVYQGKLEHFE